MLYFIQILVWSFFAADVVLVLYWFWCFCQRPSAPANPDATNLVVLDRAMTTVMMGHNDDNDDDSKEEFHVSHEEDDDSDARDDDSDDDQGNDDDQGDN